MHLDGINPFLWLSTSVAALPSANRPKDPKNQVVAPYTGV
jgi:hypothetical protein